jgi:hypothetical protein
LKSLPEENKIGIFEELSLMWNTENLTPDEKIINDCIRLMAWANMDPFLLYQSWRRTDIQSNSLSIETIVPFGEGLFSTTVFIPESKKVLHIPSPEFEVEDVIETF